MRLDAVTAELRPRGELESVDLGLAMVRRDFWRCWACWWMALGAAVGLCGWWLWDHPAWWVLLCWWFRPVGMRVVLHQLSRRLFGETPSWSGLWREVPRAWVRRFFFRLVWARFSPFLPTVMAVEDLEGLRGAAYRKRVDQLLRRNRGTLTLIYLLSEVIVAWCSVVAVLLVVVMLPEPMQDALSGSLEELDLSDPSTIPVGMLRLLAGFIVIGFSLTDIWLTGAGFGLYVNARTWIEGWDVELAFRRLGQRLARTLSLGLGVAVLLWCQPARAQAETPVDGTKPTPEEIITEVKASPDFEIKKVKYKVLKENKPTGCSAGDGGAVVAGGADILTVLMVAAAIGLVCWLLWQFRHVLRPPPGGADIMPPKPMARVVMGMAVTPESLPADLPAAVWELWHAGHHHQALALLYRGSISQVIQQARVEIREADTEGDCVRRVESAGPHAAPEYFKTLTRIWVRLAYAGQMPDTPTVGALCRDWPYREGRPA